MRKLITARARKNTRTTRMLANVRKDHSIPLIEMIHPHLFENMLRRWLIGLLKKIHETTKVFLVFNYSHYKTALTCHDNFSVSKLYH